MGAGVVLLAVSLGCLAIAVATQIGTTRTTATVIGGRDGGCAVRYTAPDGRSQTGVVDCAHVRIGSPRTVWVVSDDPGDVVGGPFPGGGALILSGAFGAGGAALVRIGRGGATGRGRHEALAPPLALRAQRRLLSRSSRRPRD